MTASSLCTPERELRFTAYYLIYSLKLTIMRQCPKCKTINPPTKSFSNTHDGSVCKHIIGAKLILFGLFKVNIYCNSINDFDVDDDWIYFRRVNKITKDLPKRVGFVQY